MTPKILWTVTIDPKVKEQLQAYARHIDDSASHLVQEMIKKALKPSGYWPPKAKEPK